MISPHLTPLWAPRIGPRGGPVISTSLLVCFNLCVFVMVVLHCILYCTRVPHATSKSVLKRSSPSSLYRGRCARLKLLALLQVVCITYRHGAPTAGPTDAHARHAAASAAGPLTYVHARVSHYLHLLIGMNVTASRGPESRELISPPPTGVTPTRTASPPGRRDLGAPASLRFFSLPYYIHTLAIMCLISHGY